MPLVDARKTSLTGVQNSKKHRLAATRLVDDAPHRRWVKPPPPPPWKKARSTPVIHECSKKLLKMKNSKSFFEHQYNTCIKNSNVITVIKSKFEALQRF